MLIPLIVSLSLAVASSSILSPRHQNANGNSAYRYSTVWQPTSSQGYGPLSIELWATHGKSRHRVSRFILKEGAYGGRLLASLRLAKGDIAHAVVVNDDMSPEFWIISVDHRKLKILLHQTVHGRVTAGQSHNKWVVQEEWNPGFLNLLDIPLALRKGYATRPVYRFWQYDLQAHRYGSSWGDRPLHFDRLVQ